MPITTFRIWCQDLLVSEFKRDSHRYFQQHPEISKLYRKTNVNNLLSQACMLTRRPKPWPVHCLKCWCKCWVSYLAPTTGSLLTGSGTSTLLIQHYLYHGSDLPHHSTKCWSIICCCMCWSIHLNPSHCYCDHSRLIWHCDGYKSDMWASRQEPQRWHWQWHLACCTL